MAKKCSIPAQAPTRVTCSGSSPFGRQGRCSRAAQLGCPRTAPSLLVLARARSGSPRALRAARSRAAGRVRSRTSAPRSPARGVPSPRRPHAAPRPPPGRHSVRHARRGVRVPRPGRRVRRARRRCGRVRRVALRAGTTRRRPAVRGDVGNGICVAPRRVGRGRWPISASSASSACRVAHPGCRRGEVELEGVARDGRRLGKATRRRRECVELADDRGGDRPRARRRCCERRSAPPSLSASSGRAGAGRTGCPRWSRRCRLRSAPPTLSISVSRRRA